MDVSRALHEINSSRNAWRDRNEAIRESYRTIRLDSELLKNRAVGEEVVVSSDPRTAFNMSNFLLTPKRWSFTSDMLTLAPDQQAAMAFIQVYAQSKLSVAITQSRSSLFGDLLSHACRILTGTGWIAVSAATSPEGWKISIWNPANVYPEYDSYGNEIVQLVRFNQVTKATAERKAMQEGWIPIQINSSSVDIKQIWFYELGQLYHMVFYGNEVVKPQTPTGLTKIPVYMRPAGGLPDDGSITQSYDWRKEIGQSIVKTTEQVQKTLDKSLSFLHQAARDAASPAYIERTRAPALDAQTLDYRGTVTRIGMDESIEPLGTPVFPPESHLLNVVLREMVQRGSFPDSVFGIGLR